ncbi:DUF5788 family protein [Methanolobus vulcani]|uniref:Methyl-accepting chemotaxis protein n=1 Tax=Methanolobus vulcani TaxID=38026 RepID=A0A7Z8P1C6_9EURY|nr:DUF5788 family protein [Methanolobus vulcani]TQD24003.1 methyl-accepting chemotaxis protein [Methanolobus vulcani]
MSVKDDTLSEWERNQLLAALHARLFWVGEEIPYSIEVNGNKCKLHELVWQLINKENLTDEDREHISKYIAYLREREQKDETKLKTAKLTKKEAKDLFNETGGILRALMDLREIEDGTVKEKEKEFHDIFSKERVAEARRWLQFLHDSGGLE